MTTVKKTTIEDILRVKDIIEEKKNIPFYSQTFDSEIEIEYIPADKFVEIVNSLHETLPLRGDCEIIYACCPIFRNKELQEAFDIDDPIDIVEKAFGNNVFEIDNLAKHIMKRYGYYDNAVENIKKQ